MRKCGPTPPVLKTQSTFHGPHTVILCCVITCGYLWVQHIWQPGILVQWHWLQVLWYKECLRYYACRLWHKYSVWMQKNCNTAAFFYSEHLYLILCPKTSLNDLHYVYFSLYECLQATNNILVICMWPPSRRYGAAVNWIHTLMDTV
jgi:hypothetical protein